MKNLTKPQIKYTEEFLLKLLPSNNRLYITVPFANNYAEFIIGSSNTTLTIKCRGRVTPDSHHRIQEYSRLLSFKLSFRKTNDNEIITELNSLITNNTFYTIFQNYKLNNINDIFKEIRFKFDLFGLLPVIKDFDFMSLILVYEKGLFK